MKKVFIIVSMILLFGVEVVNAGTWSTEKVGGFGQVHIYTPESLSPIGSGRSLLIALHGCLQTNEDMKGAKWEQASEQYGMVIALPEAMNKEGMGCWGYWSFPKDRNSKDYQNIRNLVNELTARPAMNIDKDQIYIAGLSSGGAFTMNVGCMMPDIFAGMGIDAGPSVGTDSSCALHAFCGDTDSTAKACLELAGSSYKSYFDTQITSTAYGTRDDTVDQRYAEQNAQAMAKIYKSQKDVKTETISEGSGGVITRWSNNGTITISEAKINNVPHAWPGGKNASGSYIDGSGFNYGTYLARFFKENNRRVKRNQAPALQIIHLEQSGPDIVVEGKATDPDPKDSISSLKIKFLDDCNKEKVIISEEEIVNSLKNNGSFSHRVKWPVNDNSYIAVIVATDSQSPPASTKIESDAIRVGTPSVPPSITILQQEGLVGKECTGISLKGEVRKGSQQVDSVYVQIDSGNLENADGTTSWKYKKCNLGYGKHTAIAKVIDSGGCFSYSKKVDVNIPIPYQQKSGNSISLLSHYKTYPNNSYPHAPSRGWGLCDKTYVELNKEYGISDSFTIYGTEDGTIWCVNPDNIPASQAVAMPTAKCQEWTSTNSIHEEEGRAKSSLSYSFPLGFSYYYYAVGSNEPLGRSSDQTTLRQENTERVYYQVGKCASQ